mmetsp:Transcript_16165/g.46782  ORF Transcript_16165/g.46782 Transcript_16165/m.46782 type:complete len:128 (-) Transcript_16165:246-629(-)
MLCAAQTSAVALRQLTALVGHAPALGRLAGAGRLAVTAMTPTMGRGPVEFLGAAALRHSADLYELLGVSRGVAMDDLRHAYQQALLDSLPEDEVDEAAAEAASARMEKVSMAYARFAESGVAMAPAM